MSSPNYANMFAQQAKIAEESAQRARTRDLEDREYFRSEAEKEKQEQEARDSRIAARKMKEEESRIRNLAEEERAAVEEAEEMSTVSDRDEGFGDMFAALLQGAQGGGQNFIGRPKGFGSNVKFPIRKQ